ncbi:MAG: tetratricopeptide repeat protein [Deltaproteobacteria bacterium]|nr:tetratricopeptide repeat protein [Deltaproteobacteria bacterium]
MIKDILGRMNVKDITLAENGLEALKRIQKNPDYLLLADWDLPQLTGIKLLKEIRSNKKSADTACILIISNQSQKDLEQAKTLNVTGFLRKPSSSQTFAKNLLSILGQEEESSTPELLIKTGDEFLESEQPEEALAQYQLAVQSSRDHLANLHTDMGLVLKNQGRIEEAISSLEQAVEANPESARSNSALGDAYLSAGRFEEAQSALIKALKLDPDNNEARINLADTCLQQDKDSQAEKIFKSVLQNRPDDIYALNRLGIAYRKQGKYKQAVAHYKNALKINKQDENLCFNLGRCYYEMGQTEAAQKFMKQALSINSDLKEARELLAKMKNLDS